jgi:hypothetical protein
MDLASMTEEELARLMGDVQAEQRRRADAAKAEAPKGYTGSAAGWSVQAGRLITNDDKG